MKYTISFFLLFLFSYTNAQIRGNKKIITKKISVGEFKVIDIGLFADYEINLSADPFLEISIDENLLEHVEKVVSNDTLHIDQLSWIQSSQKIVVKIGGSGVQSISQSSHSTTIIEDVNQERLTINANVGDLKVQGQVEELLAMVGTATIDASELIANKGVFSFESWGTIKSSIKDDFEILQSDNGKLFVNGKLKTDNEEIDLESIKFIKFTLRNNSANRHQFYVVGPKPDGSSFSYGFPMMPFQNRDKDWTNGTQVYKVNNLGMRKLVKTISLSDEGQVVDIFSK